MAARYPHGAWFLLSGLACLLLLVGPMTGWFVTMWLAPINIVDAGPGADEGLFAGVVLGGGVALLSLASVILILIGLDQMRLTYPVVGSRISRRVGPIILTPTWVVVLFVLIGLFSTLFSPKEAMQAPYFRAASTVGRAASPRFAFRGARGFCRRDGGSVRGPSVGRFGPRRLPRRA